MPDTNTYTTLTPIRKVISKAEFDAMDKTGIPVGTEYDLVGEIEKTDLSADLQSEIDGKLDKPATDGTAGQVLTLGTDGKAKWADLPNTGVKYRHLVHVVDYAPLRVIDFFVDTTSDNQITDFNALFEAISGQSVSNIDSFYYSCCGSWVETQEGAEADTITVTGCKFYTTSGNAALKLFLSNNTSADLPSATITDTVITL